MQMDKVKKQAEVAERMEELHKQYGHNKTTYQHKIQAHGDNKWQYQG
jgi:hypothetical protein